MNHYSSISITTRGYSHIVRGTPCEDNSGHLDRELYHLAVVADGHGDTRVFRSAVGSLIACRVAEDQMRIFAESVEQTKDVDHTSKWIETNFYDPHMAEHIGRQLGKSIIAEWKKQVREDYENNPVSDEELVQAGIERSALEKDSIPEEYYGTTLIASLLTDDYLIVIHQGDGRCVILYENGTIGQPVPWDPRCVGRYTTSMCDEDAINSFRYYIFNQKESPIIACYVASDGVEDSFESLENVNVFFAGLTAKFVELGNDGLIRYLEDELPSFSMNGSRDDVSIAGIVNAQAAEPYVEQYKLMDELQNYLIVKKQASEKIDSMYQKYMGLKRELEDAKNKHDAAVQTCSDAGKAVESIVETLKRANILKTRSETEQKSAETEFLKKKQEFEQYSARREEFVKRKEESEAKIKEIEEKLAALSTKES